MRTRTNLTLALVVTAGIGASAVLAAPAREGGRTYTTTLTGAAEFPGPGDLNGGGTASVTVNVPQKRVCYSLTVTGIEPATGAHIHVGAAGTAGPIVVPLTPPADGESAGCVDVTARLAAQILARPQLYYVNVHNAEYMLGAVRGQLGR